MSEEDEKALQEEYEAEIRRERYRFYHATFTYSRKVGKIQFDAPYFQMLLKHSANPNGRLPQDIAAHALWHYFLIGSNAFQRATQNLVYEDEPSITWKPRQVFESVAKLHGVTTADMGRYWEVVRQQRLALKLSSNADLPSIYQFKE